MWVDHAPVICYTTIMDDEKVIKLSTELTTKLTDRVQSDINSAVEINSDSAFHSAMELARISTLALELHQEIKYG